MITIIFIFKVILLSVTITTGLIGGFYMAVTNIRKYYDEPDNKALHFILILVGINIIPLMMPVGYYLGFYLFT